MQTEETVQPELELEAKSEASAVTEAAADQTETTTEEAAKPNALQEAAAAKEEPVKVAKNPVKPFQSRIDELTKNWRETERERDALKSELEAMKRGKQDQAEAPEAAQTIPAGYVPESMVDALADQKTALQRFNDDCNLTFMKGKAAFPDFEEALGTFGALGGLSRVVVEDALATDNPHEILYELGKNPEMALEIIRLPQKKRIAEMTKMTLKKPAAPSVSKAAAPIKPVAGNTKTDFDYADDKADDSEWFSRRDKERRQAGRL